MVARSARASCTCNRMYNCYFFAILFRLKRVFTQLSWKHRKSSIPQSLRAESSLLRDLRERRVEEVVDRDHAVALVERI